MFYRGSGAVFSPDVPFVDAALGRGLSRRGFRGDRARGRCVFAAVTGDQALHYAGEDRALLSVTPLPGSVVTWIAGSTDLVMELEAWLSEARFDPPARLPRGAVLLLRDVAGDSMVLETYLSLGRQRKNAEAIVDAFLADAGIRETEVREGTDVLSALGGHRGEVWITGACSIESSPDPASAFGFP